MKSVLVRSLFVCLLVCLFVVPLSYKQNLVHPKHYELLAKNTSIIFSIDIFVQTEMNSSKEGGFIRILEKDKNVPLGIGGT